MFDIFQVLVDLILRAGWNYVSVVNTEGEVLIHGSKAMLLVLRIILTNYLRILSKDMKLLAFNSWKYHTTVSSKFYLSSLSDYSHLFSPPYDKSYCIHFWHCHSNFGIAILV